MKIKYLEKQFQEDIFNNLSEIIGLQYQSVMRECQCNLGMIDILAKNMENNKDVIIEVKYNVKPTIRVNQQLIAYAYCFKDPELIAINNDIFTGFRLDCVQYVENVKVER